MNKVKYFITISLAALVNIVIAESVTFAEDTTILPTYAPGGYDKTPLFYTGRVYQGAQGRIYPYPMQDVLFDGKMDETYKYLTLQNKWFHVGLLPEHGSASSQYVRMAVGRECHRCDAKELQEEVQEIGPRAILKWVRFPEKMSSIDTSNNNKERK